MVPDSRADVKRSHFLTFCMTPCLRDLVLPFVKWVERITRNKDGRTSGEGFLGSQSQEKLKKEEIKSSVTHCRTQSWTQAASCGG
jgi:hypothetical protein